MNDRILFQIHDCIKEATIGKKMYNQIGDQQFEYFKGALVGIGNICRELGYKEELNLCLKSAKEYPFSGEEEKGNTNKIISI